ncbi:MAG: hypothetical protein ACI9ZV_000049 [Candidatus Azotimanducaceae bacterium]|jgi:hypothetical protein
MKLSESQIERRRPVWTALSNLFLDTELQDNQFTEIAERIQESGYTFEETEKILMEEVFPVLIPNLAPIAGEWAGFDEEWLHATILESKAPSLIRKVMNRISFGMIRSDWKDVTHKLKSEPIATRQRR